MSVCPHCRQAIPDRVQWGALTVTHEPDGIFWQGIGRTPLPPPMQRNVLFTLARRGHATHLALEMLSRSESGKSVSVAVYMLRRWLRGQSIPVTIIADPGVGYRLAALD